MTVTLTSFLLPFASWVLTASCKGIVVIGLVSLFRRLLASWLTPHGRYCLWFAAILCLLCPFGPPLDVPSFFTSSLRAPASHEMSTTIDAGPSKDKHSLRLRSDVLKSTSTGVERPTAIAQSGSTVPLMPAFVRFGLVLTWACVALVLSFVLLWNVMRYRRIKNAASNIRSPAYKLFLRCKTELGLYRAVAVRETPQIESPVVFGWRRPTLLLPFGLQDRLTEEQLRYVFLHELTHVQRQDVLVNWIATLAQILHWFNPVVWYGLRLIRIDMERACDAGVLVSLSPFERVEYGNTLIFLTDSPIGRSPPAHGLGIVEGRDQLKERITMIAMFNLKKPKYPFLTGALLLSLTSAALTQPRVEANAEPRYGDTKNTVPLLAQAATAPGAVTDASSNRSVETQPPKNDRLPKDTKPAAETPPTTPVQQSKAPPNVPAFKDGILLQTLIEQVSTNISRRIIADPKIANSTVALYGQKAKQIDYAGLLTILKINGFTAYELNDYINVVPIDVARTLPVPTASPGKEYPDDQFVNISIELKNACAAQLVPILRPWLPVYAYLAAVTSSNTLLIIDTFANAKRLRSTVEELDAKSKPSEQCGAPK